MTCIAGIAEDGNVWIGADSAGVSGTDLVIRKDRKVFAVGNYIIGFTTSFRMGQILAASFEPPEASSDADLEKFMRTEFIDAVRKALKAGGYASEHDKTERGGDFLVGYRGRLFHIAGDYQVGESLDGLYAVGCGAPFALGCLFSNRNRNHPRERIHEALMAAEHFSSGVRAPFFFEVCE
jgi:ATP-dependent protease HslVU (ClpYQ) peptidase subunit